MDSVTKVALAIVSLGLVAVLVVNGPNTANVIKATTGGFASSISAAQKG